MNRAANGYWLALLLLAPRERRGRSLVAGRRGAGAGGALGRATGPDRPAPAGRNGGARNALGPAPGTREGPSVDVSGRAARSGPVRPAGEPRDQPPIPTRARPADPAGVARTILASARQHRLDPLLVKAVILTESAGRPRARSPQGARGLMQLMPATARRFGVADPDDPAQNIAGGAALFALAAGSLRRQRGAGAGGLQCRRGRGGSPRRHSAVSGNPALRAAGPGHACRARADSGAKAGPRRPEYRRASRRAENL